VTVAGTGGRAGGRRATVAARGGEAAGAGRWAGAGGVAATGDAANGAGGEAAAGPELLVELRRDAGRLRAQLEDGLRDAVRAGRLAPGARLPSSRALARDLGVSRRLVVDTYDQLLAEGYLTARAGAGTFVAPRASDPGGRASAPEPPAPAPRFDFFPGAPDLAGFPRAAWLRATRDVLRTAPDRAWHYPDPRGAGPLRRALAAHLRRVRGVVADPQRLVVVGGATQGLALLGRVLAEAGERTIAVEDPSLPPHREVLAATGLEVVPVRVDGEGVCVDELARGGAPAVVVTPAHQFPLGVAVSPRRRAALLDWAHTGGLIVEDDYDAEFRYDRAPVGALQGVAPERVAYLGSASKTLAPALRLGWLVLPQDLVEPVARHKALDDAGEPVLEQLVLAHLLDTAAYDRHLRMARRRNRARRDALVVALREHLPDVHLEGLAAGLHAVARLRRPVPAGALTAAAARRSVGVYPLAPGNVATDRVALGYANLSEPAIAEGVRRLAHALREVGG
jgi:GntR family transcriptional regulator/MocR family aminotransferase